LNAGRKGYAKKNCMSNKEKKKVGEGSINGDRPGTRLRTGSFRNGVCLFEKKKNCGEDFWSERGKDPKDSFQGAHQSQRGDRGTKKKPRRETPLKSSTETEAREKPGPKRRRSPTGRLRAGK